MCSREISLSHTKRRVDYLDEPSTSDWWWLTTVFTSVFWLDLAFSLWVCGRASTVIVNNINNSFYYRLVQGVPTALLCSSYSWHTRDLIKRFDLIEMHLSMSLRTRDSSRKLDLVTVTEIPLKICASAHVGIKASSFTICVLRMDTKGSNDPGVWCTADLVQNQQNQNSLTGLVQTRMRARLPQSVTSSKDVLGVFSTKFCKICCTKPVGRVQH